MVPPDRASVIPMHQEGVPPYVVGGPVDGADDGVGAANGPAYAPGPWQGRLHAQLPVRRPGGVGGKQRRRPARVRQAQRQDGLVGQPAPSTWQSSEEFAGQSTAHWLAHSCASRIKPCSYLTNTSGSARGYCLSFWQPFRHATQYKQPSQLLHITRSPSCDVPAKGSSMGCAGPSQHHSCGGPTSAQDWRQIC